eukprot:364426-Chlamydomonas_euryale.AAC.18
MLGTPEHATSNVERIGHAAGQQVRLNVFPHSAEKIGWFLLGMLQSVGKLCQAGRSISSGQTWERFGKICAQSCLDGFRAATA